MSETGGGACITASREPRHLGTRCIGTPGQWMELRLVDETDQDVPEGEPGELLVRRSGPDPRDGFFSCYLKDPAATDTAWRGGWFHTGDVARRGPDGQMHFVDRRKNIIRRSGENIAALEVESVLQSHPEVDQVAIVAVPDPVRDEEVFACIVARNAGSKTEAVARSIQAHCLERLAYFKAPGYVSFVETLPRTTRIEDRERLTAIIQHDVRRLDRLISDISHASRLDAELARRDAEPRCAIAVVDLRSGDAVHWLRIEGFVRELYDVAALVGTQRPMALGFKSDEIRRHIVVGS